MEYLAVFFEKNLSYVIFVYGLSFIVLFLAIVTQKGRTAHLELVNSFLFLAGFALLHGFADWIELVERLTSSEWLHQILPFVKVFLLTFSFNFLLHFGLMIFIPEASKRLRWVLFVAPFVLGGYYFLVFETFFNPAVSVSLVKVVVKRFFGFPAAFLAGTAFYNLSRKFRALKLTRLDWDFKGVSLSFTLYGIFSGLLSHPYDSPLYVAGIPVQVFRALIALVLAFFVIRILAIFKL